MDEFPSHRSRSKNPTVEFEWDTHPGGGYQWVLARPVEPEKSEDRYPFESTDGPYDRPIRLVSVPEWCLFDRASLKRRLVIEGPLPEIPGGITKPLADRPALFREFLALDPEDRDAMARFADQHGTLGIGGRAYLDSPPEGLWARADPAFRAEFERFIRGQAEITYTTQVSWEYVWFGAGGVETYGQWVDEIVAMLAAWQTWSSLNAGDIKSLAEQFILKGADANWRIEGSVDFAPPVMRSVWYRASPLGTGEVLEEVGWEDPDVPINDRPMIGWVDYLELFGEAPPGPLPPGDDELKMVAVIYLRDAINRGLRHGVLSYVAPDFKAGRVVMRFQPKTLLGAMWTQFAQAVESETQHKQCRTCSSWFVVPSDGDGRRERKDFCRDACKSRFHRQKKTRASLMASEGRSIDEIAKELGVDTVSVARWLA